jgi:hypothetical protein
MRRERALPGAPEGAANSTNGLFLATPWPTALLEGALPEEEELEALALSADPDQPLDPDAAPLLWAGQPDRTMLPGWYMSPALARLGGWRSRVVLALILGFLLIEAAGLCFTYGPIVP